jgi:hypothetical protein
MSNPNNVSVLEKEIRRGDEAQIMGSCKQRPQPARNRTPRSYLSFTLTARTTGRDNCAVRKARPHSPCGLTLSMKTFPS